MHLKRHAHAICCIVMGIVLAACGSRGTPTASLTPIVQTPVPPTPRSERATPRPTWTRSPTSTDIPSSPVPSTSTATMVPGPLPDKGWPTGYFGSYAATWSPTRNELLLDGCHVGDNGLYLASAPDFTPTPLVSGMDRAHEESNGRKYCYGGAGWSPSGEHVLYMTAGPEYAIGVISRYGTNARTIVGDFQKYFYDINLSHLQCFSEQTLMLNVFLGIDAFHTNYLININTGGVQTVGHGQAVLRESSPTLGYIAYDTWLNTAHQYAAVISLVEENDYWYGDSDCNDCNYVTALNLRYSPTSPSLEKMPYAEEHFMDWLPDSNQMLIRTLFRDKESEESIGPWHFNLILWNVDKDTYVVAAPGGVYGKFSQNGSLLAYVKPSDAGSFNLQLLDMQSLMITHVYPLSTHSSGEWFPTSQMAFSPEGHYLAFISPATAEIGAKTLNLFDLNAENIAFTVPVAEKSEDSAQIPIWSPDGHALAFYDSEAKLSILDVGTRTQMHMEDIVSPEILAPDNLQWSYDGQYVSVRDSKGDVWIIEVP